MLVMVGTRTDAHFFRSQPGGNRIGIRLFVYGQRRSVGLSLIFVIRMQVWRKKTKEALLTWWRWMRRKVSGNGIQGKTEFVNLVCKEGSKTVCERSRWSRRSKGDADFRWSSLLTVCQMARIIGGRRDEVRVGRNLFGWEDKHIRMMNDGRTTAEGKDSDHGRNGWRWLTSSKTSKKMVWWQQTGAAVHCQRLSN